MIPHQLKDQRFIRVDNEKRPIETGWQREGGANYSSTDKEFSNWLEANKRYGVLCGVNNLVVIDFDDESVEKDVMASGIFPPTFSVVTARKRLRHLYFHVDDPVSWKVLDKEKNTIADVQGRGKQVVGPGTVIASGRSYDVVDDLPIASITTALIHKALDQYNYDTVQEVMQHDIDKDKDGSLTLDDFNQRPKVKDDSTQKIRDSLKISELLRDLGVSTNRNPTKCPLHSSKGGKCLSFDDRKGVFHCFHCEKAGDVITLYMLVNNKEFKEAKRELCEKLNIEDTYKPPIIPLVKPEVGAKPSVRLPQDNRTVGDFGTELAGHFRNCLTMFFKVDEKSIVEIAEYHDKQLKQRIVGFNTVTPARLLNLIEERVDTFVLIPQKKDLVEVRRSANEQVIKLVSVNTAFLECLHKIKRLLNYPIPFIEEDGTLIIPKQGYDERYQAYFTPNTPELTLLPIDEAKSILHEILGEFCFKDSMDLDMAISYLITPMCRGLYKTSTARTPLYIIQANRERAGKDYLAGVVGLIYEGRAIDDTPIVTGDKNENSNEEWRKKFTSSLKAGRRRIHSSNNRGFLNSTIMEQFLTSEVWTDRQLGGNITLELNNEIDLSMSANIGLTYTADIWYRARPINLFYGEEDPNSRVYKRTDLWGYVRANRGRILSAIYTLIKSWHDAGAPKSSIPFTSFPEWSRVVGGIMEYHHLGNPCAQVEEDVIGGDKEGQSMKEVFRFMVEYQHNHPEFKGYTIGEVRRLVSDALSSEEIDGFGGWDFTDKAHQTKFGLLIRRFVGRSFKVKAYGLSMNAKLIVAVENIRSTRVLYMFKTDVILPEVKKVIVKSQYIEEDVQDDEPPKVKTHADKLIELIEGKLMVAIDLALSEGIPVEIINACKVKGIIFEPKPGFISLVN